MSALPKIYSLPLGVSPGRALAEGLLRHTENDRLRLSDFQIYLPDRRACRTVREAFLAATDGAATILPRLLPIGDHDAEDVFTDDPFAFGDDPEVLPAIDPLERQMVLARLVRARGDETLSPAQAFALAGDLARLIDQAITENVSLEQLPGLVTGDLAEHWQKTMRFLSIIQEHWPLYLAERKLCDPATRRVLLMDKKIDALRRLRPETPILAVAMRALTPRTSDLLSVIATLPKGGVLLPGFDSDYPFHYWEALDSTHPYFMFKEFLSVHEMEPKNIKLWPLLSVTGSLAPKRQQAIHHALQPVATYNLAAAKLDAKDLHGVQFCACDNLHHEARTIALILRETLETPGKTAVVTTPDRSLGQRIAHEMQRWDITISDSGGTKLAQTPVGQFFQLILTLCDSEHPVSHFLDLCRHSLFAPFEDLDVLDLKYLRGSFSIDTLFALTLPDAPPEMQRFLDRTRQSLSFTQKTTPQSLHDWLTQHLQAAEDLSGDAEKVWQGDAAEVLARHFIALRQMEESTAIQLTAQEYRTFFRTSLTALKVLPDSDAHPRIHICSPEEAALVEADVTILAGLNEKIWPRAQTPDPWLSQPMRHALGLGDPEKMIGRSAYAFLLLANTSNVFLSWSKEREDGMALPSRWLQQIFAVLEKNKIDWATYMPLPLLWAKALDRPQRLTPRGAPSPNPDLALRPTTLSVTEVRTWFNDPYNLYAKKILRLEPADPVDHTVGAREWGTLVHRIIEEFLPQVATPQAADLFDRIAAHHLQAYAVEPLQQQRWQQQLHRIRDALIESYASSTAQRYQEITGKITFTIGNASITLQGRADLITLDHSGMTITDFKTGTLPGAKDVLSGKDPQLALLGLIAQQGGFHNISTNMVQGLGYVGIKGKTRAALVDKPLKDIAPLITANENKLEETIQRYYSAHDPYTAEQNFSVRYDPFGQLKRTAEWAIPQAEENDA